MSGTSADGIDAALVDFSQQTPRFLHGQFTAFTDTLRGEIIRLFTPGDNEIDALGELDIELGQAYREAVSNLLNVAKVSANEVVAVGLHGQTVRHRPDFKHPFTLQTGNPYGISQQLGITVVSDFRRADMTLGGQGAPLGPLFHQALFQSNSKNRVIINAGGIANISYLKTNGNVTGFDTGPANGLMDAWIEKHQGARFDADGQWADSGKIIPYLLNQWLEDPYYQLSPPKSTGKEYFTLAQLGLTDPLDFAANDIQRTLCELSAATIADGIKNYCPEADEIYISGGGAFNPLLVKRISELTAIATKSTMEIGVAPDWVEAVGFAWLAKACLERQTIATGPVTGATKPVILGAVHPANPVAWP